MMRQNFGSSALKTVHPPSIKQNEKRGAVCAKSPSSPVEEAGHQPKMRAVKFKFVGLLRGFLRRFDGGETNEMETSRPVAAAAPSALIPMPEVPQPAAPSVAVAPPPVSANSDEIILPLQPILAALPMELRAKMMPVNTTGMTISIPAEKVLTQLATGSVKISFGELRHLTPGVFANSGGEHDAKSVALPLNQILAQINPTLLSRRSAQKQVEISDDISSPFDTRGQGLKISTEKMTAPPVTPPPTPEPLPLSRFAAPPPAASVSPLPVGTPPPTFTPRWKAPAVNGGANGSNGKNGNGSHKPASFDTSLESAVPRAKIPAPAPVDKPILAPLAALSESWPEALKAEIEQLDLINAQVALPANLIEPALKRGRVIFAWRDLRSWIQNVAVAVSVHDGVELELPLKVLAPLYVTRQRNGGGPQKISVAEEIPNLFFGFPPPETPSPAFAPVPPAPVPSAVAAALPLPETNFFTRAGEPQATDSEFKRKGGTDFSSRAASPSEIVFRAMELPGVAGAVIALPDGLKVASQIPPDLNGDTLAAFLPQLFARVNQCSRELRMGDMNNLSFTVGNVPWKIFRVNAVYFAAFGRANESMPTAQLASLAAELDRKKQ
jgi:predicted regulator of Ras-like GTPase activity (Roadblock/LC7/MglB family)